MKDKQTVEERAEQVYPFPFTPERIAFIKGAKWQSSQQGWIDVNERLPEEGINVLVLEEDNDTWVGNWNGVSFDYSIADYFCTCYSITHWMPLPNPPTPTNKDTQNS